MDKAAFLEFVIEIVRHMEARPGFRVLPRRWMLERTFGWFIRWRRLARDYEQRVDPDELARDPVVTDTYTFDYHDHIYGHADTAVVGFGVNAISILPQTILTNTGNRRKYIDEMHKNGTVKTQISRHDRAIDASRPVVTRLAYHGILEKDRVRWDEVP